ncbi:MAG: S46 family peptidase [Saprospiraceae bacterium]
MIQKLSLTLTFTFAVLAATFAGEGMWIPLLLKALNEEEMQEMGMKMTAEDIYSVNEGSLKDAIVHFGGFCTGEIISEQGLLLTNHHCGYGQIQFHSSLENNYLEDGFWAKTMADELPNEGLYARFIVRIEDVSKAALKGVKDGMTESERQSVIDKNINALQAAIPVEDWQESMVRPFFKGNQYFLFVTETYRDVRLVGTPPSAIGKFGADTDNWEWPRHTGDFSMFRVYADQNNRPAEYSADNVPLKPRHSLPISLDGVAEDDFTLVFGFPGRTDEYLPSPAIQQIMDVLDPAKIAIRTAALDVINAAMQADKQTKIQYASKQARIANAWKKWIGESQGLRATDAVGKKEKLEAEFTAKVNANPEWKAQYGNLLPQFKKLYAEVEPYALQRDYYNEIVQRNIELFRLSNYIGRMVTAYNSSGLAGAKQQQARVKGYMERFYKDYQPTVDQGVFANLMQLYVENMPSDNLSAYAKERLTESGKDYAAFAKMVYGKSMLTKGKKTMDLFNTDLEKFIQTVQSDVAYKLASTLTESYRKNVAPYYDRVNNQLSNLQRTYMAALMEVFPDRRFFPDANSTMRVTYGKINGYEPRDAVYYQPVTYLDGAIQKYKPNDYEFDMPQKLLDLYEDKDYGQYAENGKVPVCILGSNHTTGGNSGSPAIDAYGNLVGLNFDRVWEGTMSDLNYDASICRNIMVDARYILFITDKYAGATRLIDEMKLVRPKTAKKADAKVVPMNPKEKLKKGKKKAQRY